MHIRFKTPVAGDTSLSKHSHNPFIIHLSLFIRLVTRKQLLINNYAFSHLFTYATFLYSEQINKHICYSLSQREGLKNKNVLTQTLSAKKITINDYFITLQNVPDKRRKIVRTHNPNEGISHALRNTYCTADEASFLSLSLSLNTSTSLTHRWIIAQQDL